MLTLKCRLTGFPLQCFVFEVLAVVAEVAAGDSPFGLNDLVAHAIEERAVVADHHQRHIDLCEVALQPLDRGHVEVVGGFVEQQKIRFLQKDLSQSDAHLPAARKVTHQPLSLGFVKADRGQQLVDAGIELVAM